MKTDVRKTLGDFIQQQIQIQDNYKKQALVTRTLQMSKVITTNNVLEYLLSLFLTFTKDLLLRQENDVNERKLFNTFVQSMKEIKEFLSLSVAFVSSIFLFTRIDKQSQTVYKAVGKYCWQFCKQCKSVCFQFIQ